MLGKGSVVELHSSLCRQNKGNIVLICGNPTVNRMERIRSFKARLSNCFYKLKSDLNRYLIFKIFIEYIYSCQGSGFSDEKNNGNKSRKGHR